MTKKVIHVIGGGTFSHVRNHLAIAAPAFGGTAKKLHHLFDSMLRVENHNPLSNYEVELHLTKMADSNSKLVTNDDVSALIDKLIADQSTRVIILNAALCDYDGSIGDFIDANGLSGDVYFEGTLSGSHEPRLKTREGKQYMQLTPADKLIGKIRKERKDIFVVGFKTTTSETSDDQYKIGLNMLKRDSLNLVVANDTVTRNNMIIAPEETRYSETTNRDAMLVELAKIVLSRMQNTFTRSTVIPGDSVAWNSNEIPDNLRQVVDHCISRGAYKPFRGSTAGHFAVKVSDNRIITTKRKTNFNNLADIGMVTVDYEGYDKVVAHGAKPSVGGQSQRVIFDEHSDLDCIVHFHSPMREDARDAVPHVNQAPNECGSHQCGQATSRGLGTIYDDVKAVMLDSHGPNIVFSRNADPRRVIEFIEANFDLTAKTGGLVA